MNKPEIVAHIDMLRGQERRYATLRGDVDQYSLNDGDALIRLSDYEALQAEYDALRAKTRLSLGVGDGFGNLFVHGDRESIISVQETLFEYEKLRRDVSALLRERDAMVDEIEALRTKCWKLAGVLELISDTDPDEGTAWFHEVADKALEAYHKGGE